MAEKLPIVCIFGAIGIELFSSATCPGFETRALDCRCYATDDDLAISLARDDPSVIITIGATAAAFPRLNVSPAEITRRWLHFESGADLARIGRAAFRCFVDNCVRERKDLPPLVSVF